MPTGIRKLAATISVHSPDSSGNTSSDLSERNTAALAFINAQLRENFPAMPTPLQVGSAIFSIR